MKKAVPYYRVSTSRQGLSGLGLEAQRTSVHGFAQANGFELIEEFVEVESGRKTNRPVLHEALETCRVLRATLLIARVDRLARNVFLVSSLIESKVKFIAVDMPYADKFVLHILSAVAEKERDDTSIRTSQALQAAKMKGVELGKHVKYILSKQNRENANLFAATMEPLILSLKRKGVITVRKISEELNRMKVPPYRGAEFKWHPTTVFNILHRIADRKEVSN